LGGGRDAATTAAKMAALQLWYKQIRTREYVRVMERKESLERRERRIERRARHDERRLGIIFGIVGGIALIGIAALVAVTLPDVKRYIKISTM
jgi:hypothetical protein